MIVLDTNVLSELMKPLPDARVKGWILALGELPLSTTTITVTEIEFGLQCLPAGRRRSDLYTRFDAFIDAMTVLPLDLAAAREAGRLRALRQAAGLPSQPSDMLIAGITFTQGAVLATRNTRDFASLPLQLTNPWQT